jgi:hypothetical protein
VSDIGVCTLNDDVSDETRKKDKEKKKKEER